MHFSKATLFTSTLIAASAAASVATRTEPSCSTGPIQCCQGAENADGPVVSKLLGLLGVVVQDLNILVGINCAPLSVIGIGSSGCNAQPFCCQNSTFNGLIAIGCFAINIDGPL
ncbi:fungal hydrophobin-domain-containing protein [Pterulicium gracile]|uniref:Hydrophobin n=1 Tax=Pterulicium gracile TaxID=1884261 RepID=A0A5C3QAS6_9AGAR|nr:fungal hydrophobin-domain-containing protein [Pterula gracilis]